MSAPEFDRDMVLTWSGKWHHVTHEYDAQLSLGRSKTEAPTLCGATGYRAESRMLINSGQLSDIAAGTKQAPVCKKCERSAAKRDTK